MAPYLPTPNSAYLSSLIQGWFVSRLFCGSLKTYRDTSGANEEATGRPRGWSSARPFVFLYIIYDHIYIKHPLKKNEHFSGKQVA